MARLLTHGGLLAGLALSGCATLSPEAAVRDVGILVNTRLDVPYAPSTSTASADVRVAQLLARPLTAEGAVELAVLANRDLRASFERLGIAQADVAATRAPPNPHLEGHLHIPANDAGGAIDVEGSLTINLIALLRNVPRSRAGEAALEQVKLELADEVLAVAAEARSRFYAVQAALQQVELEKNLALAGEAARELSQRQFEAGTDSELAAAEQAAAHQEARIELRRAELEALDARETLHRLFGLTEGPDAWSVTSELPHLPDREVSLEGLEAISRSRRLDLAAMAAAIEAAKLRITVEQWERFPDVSAGVSVEREADHGETRVGPAIGIELPIFDWNRAGVGRAEAELREAEARYEARLVDVASELRTLRARLIAARELAAYYRDAVIPLRRRAVALAQRHYNFMTLGVYDLLRAKRSEVEAEKNAIEALRDYWIARTELERAAGGTLPAERSPPPSQLTEPAREAPPETPAEHEHHHHHGGE